MRKLARLVLRAFFREVEVVGAERIPRGRPLVLVANHVNGLIDPLLLLAPLPLQPQLLAKSTLWKIPPLRPFLRLAGAIPVYRRQDQGEDTSRNAETFARAAQVLIQGGAVGLFPEGKSHSQPGLQPLKTGAARIVLQAEREHPGLGARVVPVGLLFDSKETFRSRALVQVGEPIDPAPEIAIEERDPVAAVRSLTARIDEALKDVVLHYETWDEARLIARAADLYRHRERTLPGRGSLSAGFVFRQAFLEAYHDLKARRPERVAAVAECVRQYDRLLRAFGLRDDQVAAAYPPSPVLRFVVRTLLRLLVHLPVAVLGTLQSWPVYRLVGPLVRRLTRDPDQVAALKVISSFILFPLAWIAEGWLVARWRGPWLGVAFALSAPFAGYAALLFHDRRVVFWREARAYLLLKTRKRLAEELKERRDEVLGMVEELAGLYEAAS